MTRKIQTAAPEPEWFAAWFDSEHYHRLYAHRDPAEAAALIDRLVPALGLSAGARVLDLGCGSGRHAIRLASLGFRVTGIDLSAESVTLAKQHETAALHFIRQDMREPFGAAAFDCVFSLFTSFGYFETVDEHLTVVGNIARSLAPGGLLVFDYLNTLKAERELRPEEQVVRGGVRYRISRWSDPSRIFKRIEVEEGGAVVEHVERVAKLTLDDFRFMLAVYDLRLETVFGDYELAAFDPEASPRLIVVARKAAADAAHGLRRHAEV